MESRTREIPNTKSAPAAASSANMAPAAKPSTLSGETFLRPVKRILPSDSSRPISRPEVPASLPEPDAVKLDAKASRPDVNPSAFSLFQAASDAAHQSTGSSAMQRPATTGSSGIVSPASQLASGIHRPPGRSSSGILTPVSDGAKSAAPSVRPSGADAAAASVSPGAPSRPPADTSSAPASNAEGSSVSPEVPVKPAKSVSSSSQVVARTAERRFSAPEIRYEDVDPDDERPSSWPSAILIVLLALIALAAVAGIWYKMTHRTALSSDTPASLLLVSMANRTGDNTLGGMFRAGLLLDLQQSPHLSVRGVGELTNEARLAGVSLGSAEPSLDDARKIGTTIGANELAFGSIQTEGGSYLLSMRIYDASSGSQIEEGSETATSREQIGDAIDRLASDMRSSLGESGDSIGRNLVPLSREATSSADALDAYATGESLKDSGKVDDAMFAYERAIGFDSHFTQAYIALADIYRQEHAEVAAAKASTQAHDDATDTGPRTKALAQGSYALNALGDSAQAIHILQGLCTTYTADIDAHIDLAVAQRYADSYGDSLTTAQAVLAMAPYNARARWNAELALIALGRIDDATQMEQQAQAAGQPTAAAGALLDFLNTPPSVISPKNTVTASIPTQLYLAEVLDASGQFATGSATWQNIVNHGSIAPSLASATNYALSRAGLDRALAGNCTAAQEFLQQNVTTTSGPMAELDAGLTNALCGSLEKAQSDLTALTIEAKTYLPAKLLYVPTLTAMIEWKSGNATAALATLRVIPQETSGWMAAYLEGVIDNTSNHPLLALSDMQPILDHRGSVSLGNPEVYSLAELQIARAYIASDDPINGSRSYKSFLALWANADSTNALVTEARLHSQ
jgi:tetratricopeptide (TPR) repeat protein